MPDLNQYGASINASDAGTRQVPSNPQPAASIAPIQVRKYVRNGKAPSAELANLLNASANYAALYRSKEIFRASQVPSGNGPIPSVTKWRFAFHTGPYSHGLLGLAGMFNPYTSGVHQSKATLKIYSDAAESTLVTSVDYIYGPGSFGGGFGWRQNRYPMEWVTGLSPDTDYYGRWDTSDSAGIFCACIWDMQSVTEHNSGYLTQSLTSHSPVLSIDRANVATVLKSLWKRGGSKVLNWMVDPGSHSTGSDATETNSVSITTTSTTLTNILDRTSTTISASTPGWTLDMRMKDRRSQSSGVPCVMKAFGRGSAGIPSSDLNVVLKNSAGTTIATCNGFGVTNGWVSSGQFNLPATLDKYDIQFSSSIAAMRGYLYAVSIYEYEA